MPPLQTRTTLSIRSTRSRQKVSLLLVSGVLILVWALVIIIFLISTRIPKGNVAAVESDTEHDKGQSTASVAYYYDVSGATPVVGTHTIVKVVDRTTEIVYATPTVATSLGETGVHGIALLLHGCSHSALKFFSKSNSCSACIGLSEELLITKTLLKQHSLVVLAVSSQDRTSGCWSMKDVVHIQDALQFVHDDIVSETFHVNANLPVFAFGASSGGRFAAQLAVRKIVDAAMVGVMSLGQELTRRWSEMDKKPPIYLAPMPRDMQTLDSTKRDFAIMSQASDSNESSPNKHKKDLLKSKSVILDTTTCVALPVTSSYLHQRVSHMTIEMADLIVAALKSTGHLDSTTGYLLKDPTKLNWRDILKARCERQGCLESQALGPGVSPLAKALHRCWAFHEYCSEATSKALHFFQQELGRPQFVY